VTRKVFSEVQLASGKTLGEEVIRLREEAVQKGIFLLALGFDNEGNKFIGGHVRLTNEKVIELLFDFIAWLSTPNAQEEKAPKPTPADSKFS
jgi:hypothetical protein